MQVDSSAVSVCLYVRECVRWRHLAYRSAGDRRCFWLCHQTTFSRVLLSAAPVTRRRVPEGSYTGIRLYIWVYSTVGEQLLIKCTFNELYHGARTKLKVMWFCTVFSRCVLCLWCIVKTKIWPELTSKQFQPAKQLISKKHNRHSNCIKSTSNEHFGCHLSNYTLALAFGAHRQKHNDSLLWCYLASTFCHYFND